jgi:hypothetical protein
MHRVKWLQTAMLAVMLALPAGCGENKGIDAGTDADALDGAEVAPDGTPDGDPDVPGDTPVPDVVVEGPECTEHVDCEDGEPCTVDECLMTDGVCRHTPKVDGESCDDGDFCNGYETCTSGACTSSGDPCEGGFGCIVGTCDEGADTCDVGAAPDGTDCDNGLWCDGADQCVSGTCESGPGPCTGGDGICSFATCDEIAGTCDTTMAPDGTSCDDGDPCNGSDACVSGTCALDPHRPCDDRNACTVDTCGPDGMGGITCGHTAESTGTACTDLDACAGSASRVCVASDSGTSMCAAGTDAMCGDGSLCTATDCRVGSCTVDTSPPPPTSVSCGGSVDGHNLYGASDVTGYGSCGGSLNSGERVYSVTPSGTSLTAALSDVWSSGDLTVLVLSDLCTPSTCLGSADTGGSGSVTVGVTPGSTYYIVVDGASNARGLFTVTATCS